MKRNKLLVGVAAAALLVSTAGVAAAVSDGNYSGDRQHCPRLADDSTQPQTAYPGCNNAILSVSDSNGNEAFFAGTQQTPDGQNVDPTSPNTGGDPSATDFSNGGHVYFGADDNLDSGEHDESPQVGNGPSDGGAIQFNIDPASMATWMAALSAGDSAYLLTHPLPLVDLGTGACADGLCVSVQTQRRTVFQGGNDSKERNAADYSGKQWDPDTCAGPSDNPSDCGGQALSAWNAKEGAVYADPGVQVYEDPDAQGSPEGPLYPIPSAYVGTCGVVAGGGAMSDGTTNPDGSGNYTPLGDQVVVDTGCYGKG